MTKEQYLDMCIQMESEPIDDEIPVEYSDFPFEVQQVLSIYSLLPGEWDTTNGYYMGKNLSLIPYLFKLYNIEDQKEAINLITIADQINKETINRKQADTIKRAATNVPKNH